MGEPDLSRSVWRKSSRSGGNGGNCVEVAAWRKSSHSGGNGGQCIEVGATERTVAVRDSKNPHGPKLIFTPPMWQQLTTSLKAGAFDL
jgi:hypothetical protein